MLEKIRNMFDRRGRTAPVLCTQKILTEKDLIGIIEKDTERFMDWLDGILAGANCYDRAPYDMRQELTA